MDGRLNKQIELESVVVHNVVNNQVGEDWHACWLANVLESGYPLVNYHILEDEFLHEDNESVVAGNPHNTYVSPCKKVQDKHAHHVKNVFAHVNYILIVVRRQVIFVGDCLICVVANIAH